MDAEQLRTVQAPLKQRYRETPDAARVPARVSREPKASFIIEEPQHGTLALGCTHIDSQALRRFRAFAGRRMRAFGTEHLHYGDPRGSRELRRSDRWHAGPS